MSGSHTFYPVNGKLTSAPDKGVVAGAVPATGTNSPDEVRALIERGALFVSNHSGGKDSQVMLVELLSLVPAKQILVAHASLGEIEWPGAMELAEKQAKDAGVPFIVARARYKDGSPKTFLNKVEHQFARRPDAPSFPSKQQRWCTSELKTGPIEREVRHYADANGFKLIVNCLGIRSEESSNRAKRATFSVIKRNWTAGREWYEWLPIKEMKRTEVFAKIKAAGQDPHYAYALGNDRLSCKFCIFGSRGDICNGAKNDPELLKKYSELEKKTGYSMHMSRKTLDEIINGENDV